jgi:hypothetical protein
MTKETRGVGAIAGRVGRAFQRLPSPVRALAAERIAAADAHLAPTDSDVRSDANE